VRRRRLRFRIRGPRPTRGNHKAEALPPHSTGAIKLRIIDFPVRATRLAYGFWYTEELLEVIEWMRVYNATYIYGGSEGSLNERELSLPET